MTDRKICVDIGEHFVLVAVSPAIDVQLRELLDLEFLLFQPDGQVGLRYDRFGEFRNFFGVCGAEQQDVRVLSFVWKSTICLMRVLVS